MHKQNTMSLLASSHHHRIHMCMTQCTPPIQRLLDPKLTHYRDREKDINALARLISIRQGIPSSLIPDRIGSTLPNPTKSSPFTTTLSPHSQPPLTTATTQITLNHHDILLEHLLSHRVDYSSQHSPLNP